MLHCTALLCTEIAAWKIPEAKWYIPKAHTIISYSIHVQTILWKCPNAFWAIFQFQSRITNNQNSIWQKCIGLAKNALEKYQQSIIASWLGSKPWRRCMGAWHVCVCVWELYEFYVCILCNSFACKLLQTFWKFTVYRIANKSLLYVVVRACRAVQASANRMTWQRQIKFNHQRCAGSVMLCIQMGDPDCFPYLIRIFSLNVCVCALLRH